MSTYFAAASAFAASTVPPVDAYRLARIGNEALEPEHNRATRKEKR